MTKAPTPAEMSKGQSDNTNNDTKKFDYTVVADRLRTVSWNNYGHPTGVVNLVTQIKQHTVQNTFVHMHTKRRASKTVIYMYYAAEKKDIRGILPEPDDKHWSMSP